MNFNSINFNEKLSKFDDLWSPKVIAEMNDYQFKTVKVQGDFVWHKHDETDEVFIVLEGELAIEFRGGKVELKAGEMFVVPKIQSISHLRKRKRASCWLNLKASSIQAIFKVGRRQKMMCGSKRVFHEIYAFVA